MSRINATHDVTAGAYGGDAYYVMITDDFDDGSDFAFAKVSADAFDQCRGDQLTTRILVTLAILPPSSL